MATFIPGITDYIPQIQPFKPDYAFLGSILQTKQTKYDAARKQISEAYGALLNAPLTKDENVKRRDNFFKMIDQDIKRISGLDLSLEQNKNIALNIFKPLYEDKYMAKDMAWTKNFENKVNYAERLKYCADPEKCGGVSYSEEGLEYLGYQRERFKTSSMDDSLSFDNPTYAGDPGLQLKALKFAKDMGYDLKTVSWSKDGFYKIERTNDITGTTGQTYLKSLTQAFMGAFGNDGKVKDFYNQKAAVDRERTIRTIAPNFNNDLGAAEDYYNQEMLKIVGPSVKQAQEDADELLTSSQNKVKLLEQKVKKDGRVPGDTIDNVYVDAQGNLKIAKANSAVVDEITKEYTNTTNTTNDRKYLSKTVDRLLGNKLLEIDLHNTATQHANLNYEEKYDVDQYRLAAYNDQLARGRMKLGFEYDLLKQDRDFQIKLILDQKKYEREMGITPEDKSFITLPPSPGSTAPQDALKDIQTLRAKSFQATDYMATQITDSFVNEMLGIINNTGSSKEDIADAKKQLKTVLRDYDETSNKFITESGERIEATVDNYKKTANWKNTTSIVNTIKKLVGTDDYKVLYEDLTIRLAPALKAYSNETLFRAALHKTDFENNGKIKGVMESTLVLLDEDRRLLDIYFKKDPRYGNEAYNTLSLSNFINEVKERAKDPTSNIVYKSDKHLTELYNLFSRERLQLYKSGSLGNKPLVKNPVYPNKGFNISSPGTMVLWDAGKIAAGTGAVHALGILADLISNPDVKVYKGITDLTGKDDVKPTNDKSVLEQFYKDLRSPGMKTGDTRPRGHFIYRGVAGNNPDMESYLFIPEAKYAEAKNKKDKKDPDAGKKLVEPVLVTLPKSSAKNNFSAGFRISQSELLLNMGPIIIDEYPGAGNVKLERLEDGSVLLSGEIFDYNNGQLRKKSVNDKLSVFNDQTFIGIETVMAKFQEMNLENKRILNDDKRVYSFDDLKTATQ